jgi:hypothetical protein
VTPARRALLDWLDTERRHLLAALEAEMSTTPSPVDDMWKFCGSPRATRPASAPQRRDEERMAA